MENIHSITELKKAILLLEKQQKEEEFLLKEQFLIITESLKPANIIKSTFLDLSKNTDMKDNILNNSLSLAIGYISKKIILGNFPNPLKETLGAILQIGVSSIMLKHSSNIKSGLSHVFHMFSNKKETTN